MLRFSVSARFGRSRLFDRRPEMHGEMVPILIVMTVFAYLGWRRYLAHQERIAAIQRGMDPRTIVEERAETDRREKVSRAPRDHRLGSMILIAVGLAYMVAIFFSVGAYKGLERAIAAAVWGIIPLSIGVSRFVYDSTRSKMEAEDGYRRTAFVLITVGIAYMICITFSTGMLRGPERAMAAGVWGIIPLAIGVAMFVYGGMVRRERSGQGVQRGEGGG
jgi:cadmium resistance protein CadD (predicted permease)